MNIPNIDLHYRSACLLNNCSLNSVNLINITRVTTSSLRRVKRSLVPPLVMATAGPAVGPLTLLAEGLLKDRLVKAAEGGTEIFKVREQELLVPLWHVVLWLGWLLEAHGLRHRFWVGSHLGTEQRRQGESWYDAAVNDISSSQLCTSSRNTDCKKDMVFTLIPRLLFHLYATITD